MHQDEAARQSLRRYLELAPESEATEPERASACLALSQLAERQGDYAQAARWLDKIELDEGEAAATVLIARARLLARQGRMNEAVSLIRQAPEDGPLDARAKVLAEGNLLHSEGLPRAAFALLRSALDEAPDDPDLLYETALAAEQSGDMTETERLLRRLIQLRPESAPGYNTLGYLLADRKQRLPEARELIEKAVSLAPHDPFIQDSLGWIAFRQGRLDEARRILEDAFERQPEAEIGAHLGEALWAQGERERAQAIWREALRIDPRNQTLAQTLKRLGVQPGALGKAAAP